MDRRTLTMNWDGLGENDDDDRFFESYERMSLVLTVPVSDNDDGTSFVSIFSSLSFRPSRSLDEAAEPGDIKEQWKRHLEVMDLASNKDCETRHIQLRLSNFKKGSG
ncbi:unnamed protein product [Fraxinus pennsylvanica]|uniref:Uncharacterized protein n=1 Tax=Fraxinus pennsylvanica TaxID=56036 RepID=A0AAD2ECZ3_9LAMI|nr:unnamed protein product [Fraxinus pennsylvanica]